jgi:hypothetical protein
VEQNSQFDRTHGTSELTCTEFDALLTDALDGVLGEASQRRFEMHRQRCPTCGPLFRETAAGMSWLSSLELVEPPSNLVHNILAATSAQASAASAAAPKLSWKERLSEVLRDVASPLRGLVREPRLLMTVAMAIFSVTLSLNLVGVRLSDLRHFDLRPSAIRENATLKYTEASNRVIQYYYSIRLVYEVESRLQELKRATTTEEPQQQRPPDRNKTENKKRDQEREQNYYSMERQNGLLASLLVPRSINELNHGSTQQTGYPALQCAIGPGIVSIHCASTELSRGLEQDKSIRSLLA